MSNRLYAFGELEDGTTWKDIPVPVATRVQCEQTGHVKKWSVETHAMTVSAFMSWHVSRARGIHSLKWEEFLEQAIEADVDNKRSDDDGGEDDPEETPTQTAP